MKRMNMKIIGVIGVAAVLTMGACTNDGSQAEQGLVALQVNAVVGGAQSRAGVTTSTFAKGDRIGLFLEEETTSRLYTADADGQLVASTPYYFEDEEVRTVKAYYPYATADELTDGVVKFSTATQSDALDKMYAQAVKVSIFDPDADLVFAHQMSKITVRLISPDGSFTTKDKVTAQISSLYTEGTFDIATGKVEYDKNVSSTSVAMEVTNVQNIDNQFAQAEAIVFPQELSKALTFTLTQEDLDYDVQLPLSDDMMAKEGCNYVYTVEASKTALTVISGVSITDWNSHDTEEVKMKYYGEPYEVINDPEEVRTFDVLLFNGTFVRFNGETEDVLKDNISEFMSESREEVIGIVFWTQAEDAHGHILDEYDMSQYQHGLIVSTRQYNTRWNPTEEAIPTCTDFEQMLGYRNTLTIKQFSSSDLDMNTYPLGMLEILEEQNYHSNSVISEWYIPGACEFFHMLGDGEAEPSGDSGYYEPYWPDDSNGYEDVDLSNVQTFRSSVNLGKYNKLNVIFSTLYSEKLFEYPGMRYVISMDYSGNYCYSIYCEMEEYLDDEKNEWIFNPEYIESKLYNKNGSEDQLFLRPICAF
jgi:hypothetical protein